MFEIKNVKLVVKPVTNMLTANTDNQPTSVSVSYLTLKGSAYPEDLLSELYYRNAAMHSYADSDIHKVAPEIVIRTHNKNKIKPTRIINKQVLLQLRDKYGPEWPVGNDTSLVMDTAYHCGFIQDIFDRYSN